MLGDGRRRFRQRFVRRQNDRLLHLVERALGRRIEVAQAVDLVVEELDAQWLLVDQREDVEDAAAPAERPRLDDHLRRLVTQLQPTVDQLIHLPALADLEHQRRLAELVDRQRPRHQRAGRGDDDRWRGGRIVVAGRHEGGQRLHAVADDVLAPRTALVKQRRRLSEAANAGVRPQPGGNLLGDVVGAVDARRQVNDRTGPVTRERRQHERARRAQHAQVVAVVLAGGVQRLTIGRMVAEEVDKTGQLHGFLLFVG